MVQDDEYKREFAERLRYAMRNANWPDRGSQAKLAALTNTTAKAASKWVNGDSVPRRGKLKTIARELKVHPTWLEHGEGMMSEGVMEAAEREHEDATVRALNNLKGKVTPRSQTAIDRIESAALEGRLSEEDLVLLEGIAARFENRKQE